jgi:hypothetical protein
MDDRKTELFRPKSKGVSGLDVGGGRGTGKESEKKPEAGGELGAGVCKLSQSAARKKTRQLYQMLLKGQQDENQEVAFRSGAFDNPDKNGFL